MKLKIPPVVVTMVFALLMWAVSNIDLMFGFKSFSLAILSILLGVLVIILGVLEFKKAKVTLNPLDPEQSQNIVSAGIYQYTRNPMYLGMALILVGVAFYFGGILLWFFVGGFLIYMTYFQIMPEEEILTKNFGKTYLNYKQKVRRWI
ncbi:MAG: isoprenylcysteine carboxylmethyltransferase family protein [Moraxella sp.]|nr:isoprenylcysteine carboxylmethyltransferase family protein [Moraxella sp.]